MFQFYVVSMFWLFVPKENNVSGYLDVATNGLLIFLILLNITWPLVLWFLDYKGRKEEDLYPYYRKIFILEKEEEKNQAEIKEITKEYKRLELKLKKTKRLFYFFLFFFNILILFPFVLLLINTFQTSLGDILFWAALFNITMTGYRSLIFLKRMKRKTT